MVSKDGEKSQSFFLNSDFLFLSFMEETQQKNSIQYSDRTDLQKKLMKRNSTVWTTIELVNQPSLSTVFQNSK